MDELDDEAAEHEDEDESNPDAVERA